MFYDRESGLVKVGDDVVGRVFLHAGVVVAEADDEPLGVGYASLYAGVRAVRAALAGAAVKVAA